LLRYRLTHPPLLGALGAAGHGSQVLIADGNYPHSTGISPTTELIHLNLRPGLVEVADVLELVLDAVPVEAAHVMNPDDGTEAPILATFRTALGPAVPITGLARHDFYGACRVPNVAVAIATGEERWYANILLTIGAIPTGALA
jgi:L-fucose mutarotase